MLDGRGVRFWGQSHFPDCLVLMEAGVGGVGVGARHHKDESSLQTLLLTLKSLVLCGNGDGKKKGGSAVRGQAYRMSRKSRTQEVGTDYKSVLPLWDQSQKLRHGLFHYLLSGKKNEAWDQKRDR